MFAPDLAGALCKGGQQRLVGQQVNGTDAPPGRLHQRPQGLGFEQRTALPPGTAYTVVDIGSDIGGIQRLQVKTVHHTVTHLAQTGLREQIVGCVLGLVVGDAVGVPVEFKSRAQLDAAPVTDMTGFGTYNQPPGTWSDDSSLALSTAESLLAGYDPADMMRRFHAWLTTAAMTPHGEVFDVGIATRAAIARYAQGEPPEAWGGRGERDNGNGSLMRISPIGNAT